MQEYYNRVLTDAYNAKYADLDKTPAWRWPPVRVETTRQPAGPGRGNLSAQGRTAAPFL
jgi:hypothetical protein